MINPNADEYSIQIFSEYDGWTARVIRLSAKEVVKEVTWSHNHTQYGSGGEQLLAELFMFLAYHVYIEEVC